MASVDTCTEVVGFLPHVDEVVAFAGSSRTAADKMPAVVVESAVAPVDPSIGIDIAALASRTAEPCQEEAGVPFLAAEDPCLEEVDPYPAEERNRGVARHIQGTLDFLQVEVDERRVARPQLRGHHQNQVLVLLHCAPRDLPSNPLVQASSVKVEAVRGGQLPS